MPNIQERKQELKYARSDALQGIINVVRAKYGSDAPPIESMIDKDRFNLQLLFGRSENENIDWNNMGVEGLIRCYYNITYHLRGVQRNNIIKAGGNSGTNSGLEGAVTELNAGRPYRSGFYKGWDVGIDGRINEPSDQQKAQWSRAEFDKESFSFGDNRSKYSYFDSNALEYVAKYPDDDTNTAYYLMGDIINLIGQRSPMGQKDAGQNVVSGDEFISRGWVHDSVLGRRNTDIHPKNSTYHPATSGGDDDDDSGGEGDDDNGGSEAYYTYTYGDGSPDPYINVDGYQCDPNYWDPALNSLLSSLRSRLVSAKNFINYSKVQNETYFANPDIIPYRGSWSKQNSWLNQLDAIINHIDDFNSILNRHYSGGNQTSSSGKGSIDTGLDSLKSQLSSGRNTVNSIASEASSSDILGDANNALTLRGQRFLWVRAIIDPTDGTKVAIGSVGTAVSFMRAKLNKSEEELAMFGVYPDEYIPTPFITGIEPYYVLNAVTYEMEIGGWFVSWAGMDHCNGYDVWKSNDYDPETEQGTWTKLSSSQGSPYTMTDVDANTGKVLVYIIDTNVQEGEKPYYKVKSYDRDTPGLNNIPRSGEFDRKNAESEICEPVNADAFPSGGDAQVDTNAPRRTPSSEPVTINKDRPSTIPPGILAWTTNLRGTDAEDLARRRFKSDIPFDSIASNLMVFVDQRFKNQDTPERQGDYILVADDTIEFYDTIPEDSEVNLHVFLRSFQKQGDWVKGIVSNINELPTDPKNGDVWFVENPEPGAYYRWEDPPGEWIEIPESEMNDATWKNPVNTFNELPGQFNTNGDIRLVLEENEIYVWDAGIEAWAKISGSSGSSHWKDPVLTMSDLPTEEVENGDVILVIEEEAIYRWSSTLSSWKKISGEGGEQKIWKNPVSRLEDLPEENNEEGDVRLVLKENKMYSWSSFDNQWLAIIAEAELGHSELLVEDWETVDDHDSRYYTETEMDETLSIVNERLAFLESLRPKNATPLGGHHDVTGTKLFKGHLSESTLNRFETFNAFDYTNKIIKDANFILNNRDTTQFNNADSGVLYLYINDVEVDTFDLGFWFNEDERAEGQSYPRKMGVNNKIEILSVGPYNQYPTYQRADYQINLNEEDFEYGENKVQLVHEVGNAAEDVNSSDPYIFFWDEFDGIIGFSNVSVEETNIQSSKYLSGIRYYSNNDSIRVRFTAERLFNNTYLNEKQVFIELEELAVENEEIMYESNGVINNIIPRINVNLHYSKEFSIQKNDIYSSSPNVYLTGYRPGHSSPRRRYNQRFLINTVSGVSSDKKELFLDEIYRLPLGDYNVIPSSMTGNWNSEDVLSPSNLMIFDRRLMYPSISTQGYYPEQTVDYTTFAGNASYIRAFKDVPRSNGTFYIKGFLNIDHNIKVELKIPGQTGWLSLNNYYNEADFEGHDGDGCLIQNYKNEFYEFTLGNFNTVNSNNIIIMKITFYQKTNFLEEVELI